MNLRRWLLTSAVLCVVVGLATLATALCCIAEVVGGQCELWLLGPLLALPLGLGLGMIGRAAGRTASSETPELVESQECAEREQA